MYNFRTDMADERFRNRMHLNGKLVTVIVKQ